MMQTIINTSISFVVGSILTYCVGRIKHYKKTLKKKEENEQVQNVALQTILQSQLTSTYFVYQEIGEIPDYVYKNWLNMLKIYEQLGGNDYIHILASRMKEWKITKTDILK